MAHKHDWKLMEKNDIHSRFENASPTRETVIDIILDPGDRSERWRCVDCGEEKFFFYTPQPFLKALVSTHSKSPLNQKEK